MDKDLRDVSDWMKTTDLVEVAWKKGAKGFALAAPDAPSTNPSAPPLPASRFLPVASEGVGVFQFSEPGKARKAEEGAAVAAGDVLGVVVAGSGKPKPVTASSSGRVVKVFVEAGQAVEYGQPLFLVEPA